MVGSPEAVVGVVKHVLNVGYEYPDTSLLVEACPGLRPALNPSMWESLVKAVINQQIPTRLALRITSRLVECLGERVVVGGKALYDFPSPEAVLGAGPPLTWRLSLIPQPGSLHQPGGRPPPTSLKVIS